MASRLGKMVLGVFFDTEGLAEANRKYRERMAEINANDAEVKAAIADARTENKEAFRATIAANTAKRKAQLKAGRY
jgi:hypothetical protein